VFGLTKGVIVDLDLSTDGTLRRLASNDGSLRSYDIDGRTIDPSLPIDPKKQTRLGKFAGCAVCREVIAEGGSITGFIMKKERVAAIVAQYPIERVKPKPVVEIPKTTQPLPYVQLVGSIPFASQPTAGRGDTVQVFGSDFCPTARCSPVTIRIGDRVVASDVKVDEKGTFKTRVTVTEMAGHYRVIASQKADNGKELRDERLLVVPILDVKER
jgi:hypothetical protein